ncbi:septum formation initiator [Cephaloticoccus primus]|uniref:Septum formation initiator n=1 Tax=Cephaloticoccus primus TaxID=1548207 RepID=A0A139SSW4_9BACT|nr:septum formation initiator family protein [Cephaloticoccus primus]KXU37624.1 septum formation initiator [Cephaloticoccus primus]
MNVRRFVITLYLTLFGAGVVAAGVFFWQAQQEYAALRANEQQTQAKLVEAQRNLSEQERTLERLQNDPAYVERVIRQRLGYAKPDEYIVRIRE